MRAVLINGGSNRKGACLKDARPLVGADDAAMESAERRVRSVACAGVRMEKEVVSDGWSIMSGCALRSKPSRATKVEMGQRRVPPSR